MNTSWSKEQEEWLVTLLESTVIAACVDLGIELIRMWRYRHRDNLEREKVRLEVQKMRQELADAD